MWCAEEHSEDGNGDGNDTWNEMRGEGEESEGARCEGEGHRGRVHSVLTILFLFHKDVEIFFGNCFFGIIIYFLVLYSYSKK